MRGGGGGGDFFVLPKKEEEWVSLPDNGVGVSFYMTDLSHKQASKK